MAQIWQISSIFRNFRLLQPQKLYCQKVNKYSDKIHEAGKAKENVHFLKKQRQQLKELRQKILKERELIRERIETLDKEIDRIKQKIIERNRKDRS